MQFAQHYQKADKDVIKHCQRHNGTRILVVTWVISIIANLATSIRYRIWPQDGASFNGFEIDQLVVPDMATRCITCIGCKGQKSAPLDLLQIWWPDGSGRHKKSSTAEILDKLFKQTLDLTLLRLLCLRIRAPWIEVQVYQGLMIWDLKQGFGSCRRTMTEVAWNVVFSAADCWTHCCWRDWHYQPLLAKTKTLPNFFCRQRHF